MKIFITKVSAFIAEQFRTREYRVKRVRNKVLKLIDYVKENDLNIKVTMLAQLLILDGNRLIAIVELKRVAYEASVIFNSFYKLSKTTVELEQYLKKLIPGEISFTSLDLYYDPQTTRVLIGEEAREIIEDKKPYLSLINPEDLN